MAESSLGVVVSIDGIKHHRGTRIAVKPLTILLGEPGSGKSSFTRTLYLAVWLARGRRGDVLLPAVLSPPPERFCARLGSFHVCWRDGRLIRRGGEAPWRRAVLLPCDYYTRVKALYEVMLVARAVASGLARAAGLGVLLGVAMRVLGESSFLGGLGLLAADLFSVYEGEDLLTPLGGLAKTAGGMARAVLTRMLRGVDPLRAPSSVIARRALLNLLLDAPSDTLVVLEEPLLAILGGVHLAGRRDAEEAAERIRRGEVWLAVSLSMASRLGVETVRGFIHSMGLRDSAAVYRFMHSGHRVIVSGVQL